MSDAEPAPTSRRAAALGPVVSGLAMVLLTVTQFMSIAEGDADAINWILLAMAGVLIIANIVVFAIARRTRGR